MAVAPTRTRRSRHVNWMQRAPVTSVSVMQAAGCATHTLRDRDGTVVPSETCFGEAQASPVTVTPSTLPAMSLLAVLSTATLTVPCDFIFSFKPTCERRRRERYAGMHTQPDTRTHSSTLSRTRHPA